MIDLQSWLDAFTKVLQDTFPNRIWFVGLQGSYRRGEATEGSDLDVVVILDELTPADVRTYGAMLDGLPHRELICGFLSGKAELLSWEPSDLVQFYHDTQPIIGSLDDLLPLLDDTAVDRAIKIGACNVYHGCVHNMLHEKSEEILRGLYKSASFTVQAVALRRKVIKEDRLVAETALRLKKGGEVNFDQMSETLFCWAKNLIEEGNRV